MKQREIMALLAMTLLTVGCQEKPKEAEKEKKQEQATQNPVNSVKRAIVRIAPTSEQKVYGVFSLISGPNGVRVLADVAGLKPGRYPFHLSNFGYLGDLQVNELGNAHFDQTLQTISLNGPDSIVEKSIIVFSPADGDETDVGQKLGTGVIQVIE